MSVHRRVRRGEIRCEVARDVADELVKIATERENAADLADGAGQNGTTNARELRVEALTLRSVAYAIRQHNVQS